MKFQRRMTKRKHILRMTAGMIISVLIFLFIHSETELFDTHTDSCKDLDICLILEKASFENHHDIDFSSNSTFNSFQLPVFNNKLHISELILSKNIDSKQYILASNNILSKIQVLII